MYYTCFWNIFLCFYRFQKAWDIYSQVKKQQKRKEPNQRKSVKRNSKLCTRLIGLVWGVTRHAWAWDWLVDNRSAKSTHCFLHQVMFSINPIQMSHISWEHNSEISELSLCRLLPIVHFWDLDVKFSVFATKYYEITCRVFNFNKKIKHRIIQWTNGAIVWTIHLLSYFRFKLQKGSFGSIF